MDNRQSAGRRAWRMANEFNYKNAILLFAALIIFQLVFACGDAQPLIPPEDQPPPDYKTYCDSIGIRADGGSGFYEDNPTYFDYRDDTGDWAFSNPSSEGMNDSILTAGFKTLGSSPSIFSMIVIRRGKIIKEQYFNGCDSRASNNVHSSSKSILGALTGIAIAKGFIESEETKLSSILPEYFTSLEDPRKDEIRIKHLLTMSAGLYWEEDYTEYEIEEDTNWAASILNQPLNFAPGTAFNYSTGLTHVLSAAIQRAAGVSLCEFANIYLFEDLEIDAEHWGRDPKGVFSGGYNFYATARELAKFGLLYLNGGKYNGKQLVPQDWVEKSLQNKIADDEVYSYGYLWWLRKISGYKAAIAWGYGGQFAYLLPEADLLVVSTANTKDYFEEFDINSFVEDYVIPAIED